MKAALINEYGSADVLSVGELPMPVPGNKQVLVRVHAAAINPKDTFIRKGRFSPMTGKKMPLQTGFDFAGEVVEVGSAVAGCRPGDQVFGMLREIFHGRACAEFLAVSADQFAAKPASLSYEEAAALPLASLTALQALRDDGGILEGDRLCINGASGGVGSMAVQIGKVLGAHVTAIGRKENHAFLRELGADACIDYRDMDIRDCGEQFDVFFDVFGNQPFREIRDILTLGGTWVSTVLQPHVFGSAVISRVLPGPNARLVMVKSRRADLELLREWVDAGKIRPIVHAVYPLEQIGAAHLQQESKHTRGKLVIRIIP